MPASKSISGVNSIHFRVLKDMDSMQIDLSENFKILGIVWNKYWLYTSRDSDFVTIRFTQTLKAGSDQTIDILYDGKPREAVRPPWDGGFQWLTDSAGKPWVTVSCEGLGASSWWPCKDHLSDEPDSMRITCDCPKGLTCISNGNLLNQLDLQDGFSRFIWFVHYPINSYNVTLNIGDYYHIEDTYYHYSGKPLELDYYVLSGNEQKAKAHFAQVKPMLDCYEKHFGEYPFQQDGYALIETPYWGMEHQSAVSYGNHYLNNRWGFDFIIIHESGHEWFGNSLSCTDQGDMWLHEGFTTYMEAVYLECKENYDTALAYLLEQRLKISNTNPVIGPFGVNFHEREDNDIYYKGTWILHTLRSCINNDSLWWKMLYDYSTHFSRQMIQTKDFTDFVKNYTHTNFDLFFKQYLTRPQIPNLVYTVKSVAKVTTITYHWENVEKGFTMPVEFCFGKKKQRVNCSTVPQAINIGNVKPNEVQPATDRFLIESRLE